MSLEKRMVPLISMPLARTLIGLAMTEGGQRAAILAT
jgi:hypothetical protein